jgi:dihydroneopterin aldolase
MAADRLRIEGLRVAAWIGVPSQERSQPQPLRLNIELEPQRPLAGLGDDFQRAIDYESVAARVREIAAREKRRLIETLADDIATELLGAYPVASVTVEVQKFILPHCDYVSVRLHKARGG